jgi:hypothetical protein
LEVPPAYVAQNLADLGPVTRRDDGTQIILFEQLALEKYKKEEGYIFSLERFRDFDGLKVTVVTRYLLAKDRFTSWTMTHPSKAFNFAISYPEQLTLVYESLGNISISELDIVQRSGQFSARYDSWILPDSGFVYQFRAAPNSDGH